MDMTKEGLMAAWLEYKAQWKASVHPSGARVIDDLTPLLRAGSLLCWTEGDVKKAIAEAYFCYHGGIRSIASVSLEAIAVLNDFLIETPNELEALELRARKEAAEATIAKAKMDREDAAIRAYENMGRCYSCDGYRVASPRYGCKRQHFHRG